jgi:formylglycine-generating enzyme required for sulfatase activity
MDKNVNVVCVLILLVLLLVGCGNSEYLQTESPTMVGPSATYKLKDETSVSSTDQLSTKTPKPAIENRASVTVMIPSGTFLMGDKPETGLAVCEVSRTGCSLDDFLDEAPVHEVFLDAFWIDKFEVTNLDFRRCVDAGVCTAPKFLEFFHNPDFRNHPVVFVSWHQAEEYCQWVGGHLPSEAQWEKAAKGEDVRLFPWGDELNCGKANLRGCTQGLTAEIGSYPEGASPFGVIDMAGNVAEWVADWYDSAYYSDSPYENPAGPEEGEMKVARGGSWKNPFAGVRVTNRSANFPEGFSSGTGFRCGYDAQP